MEKPSQHLLSAQYQVGAGWDGPGIKPDSYDGMVCQELLHGMVLFWVAGSTEAWSNWSDLVMVKRPYGSVLSFYRARGARDAIHCVTRLINAYCPTISITIHNTDTHRHRHTQTHRDTYTNTHIDTQIHTDTHCPTHTDTHCICTPGPVCPTWTAGSLIHI